MRISVHGCGFLGAVHAACMAQLGHEVVGVDIDQSKIDLLAAGQPPFYEPSFPELLSGGIASGRLTFTTDASHAADARVHFIAVGTPQVENGQEADLSYVYSAIDTLIPYLGPGHLVVGKSTVPVGTAAYLAERVEATGALLAWNPEFLREGFAVVDTLTPDRIVYGLPKAEAGTRARQYLDEVYHPAIEAGTPLIATDYATAELVKMSANAFLATKISFINAISEIAEHTGADITALADAIGHDARIGRRFLNAGIGFGGGCLPKDIRSFVAQADTIGRGDSLLFLKEVDAINIRQRRRVVDLTAHALGGTVRGKKIALLGLAFKPNTDDIRDSPALAVADLFDSLGAQVIAVDQQAAAAVRKIRPNLAVTTDVATAVESADAVVVVTEWDEFRTLDPHVVIKLVAQPIVIDGRNCLDPDLWIGAGWSYTGLGRSGSHRPAESNSATHSGELRKQHLWDPSMTTDAAPRRLVSIDI